MSKGRKYADPRHVFRYANPRRDVFPKYIHLVEGRKTLHKNDIESQDRQQEPESIVEVRRQTGQTLIASPKRRPESPRKSVTLRGRRSLTVQIYLTGNRRPHAEISAPGFPSGPACYICSMASGLLRQLQKPVRPPAFLFYFWARGFSAFSYQIATVAVGWQVYALTNSAFALGMVGLVQFIPSALLVFVAGTRRRPLRPQAGGAGLPDCRRAGRGISGLGQLCRDG